MAEVAEELEQDLYESLEEVPEELGNEPTDEEFYEVESPSHAAEARVAELEALVGSLQDEVADYKHRLGEAVRKSGEKLKEKEKEIDEWLANVNVWHQQQVNDAAGKAYLEGVAKVEGALLPKLMAEEKADYLEQARKETPILPVAKPLDIQRKTVTSDPSEAIHELVEQYVADGVPEDQLDTSSIGAVTRSGNKYLREQAKPPEVSETRQREATGATRVSGGGGGTARPARPAAQAELLDVEEQLQKAKSRGDMNRGAALLKRKRELEAAIRAARVQRQ